MSGFVLLLTGHKKKKKRRFISECVEDAPTALPRPFTFTELSSSPFFAKLLPAYPTWTVHPPGLQCATSVLHVLMHTETQSGVEVCAPCMFLRHYFAASESAITFKNKSGFRYLLAPLYACC